MRATTELADRSLAMPRVAAALCGILILALVLPFVAVRTFHERRLERADRELQDIGLRVTAALASNGSAIPGGTQVLTGDGQRPVVIDDTWNTTPGFPLSRAIGAGAAADPWGNAYLVNIRARDQPWVISAGPDGILQTPFPSRPAQPTGDDRAARVR